MEVSIADLSAMPMLEHTPQLFNIGFIAIFQNLLLLAITLPTYFAWHYGQDDLSKKT